MLLAGVMRASALVVVIAAAAAAVACAGAPEPPVDYRSFEDVRRIVAALDDVAGEYPLAVDRGALIDPVRMRTLDRLLHDAQRYAQHLTEAERGPLAALAAAIDRHDDAAAVAGAARRLRTAMLARRHLVLAPAAPPARARAAQLWLMVCAGCHGEVGVGDGPQGLDLEPEPKNFHDPDFMADLSPSRAFSRITDGVPGTAMPSWGFPSTSERWGLAALVFGFRHDPAAVARGRALVARGAVSAPWTALADRTDGEVLAALARAGVAGDDADDALAYLRGEAAFAPVGGHFADVRAELALALAHYQGRRWADARHHFALARRRAGARLVAVAAGDRALAARIEEQLARLTTAADDGELEEEVAHELARTQGLLDRAEAPMAAHDGVAGARLAIEHAALAALALALALRGRRPRRPRAARLVVVAAVALGVVVGAAIAGSTAAAIVTLAAVGGLGLALVAPQRGDDLAPAAALALLVGLPVGAGAAGQLPSAPLAALALAGLALGALAAAIAALVAVGDRRPPRPTWSWPAIGALALAAAAAAGRGAWLLWTIDGPATDLVACPRIDAIGLYPARSALAAAAAAAALGLAIATAGRGRWRDR